MLEKAISTAPIGQPKTVHGLAVPSEQERKQLLGQIAASRALITAYYGDSIQGTVAQTIGQATVATQQFLKASRLHQAADNLADSVLNMASTAVFLHLQVQLQDVWQTCQQAIALVSPYGTTLSALACFAYARHAHLLREWNQLDATLELVQQSIHLGAEIVNPLALLPGYEVIVPILLSRGDLTVAESSIQGLRQFPCIVDNACLLAWWFTGNQVRLWLLKGELDTAKHWAEMLVLEKRSVSSFIREREDVAHARVLLALHQPDKVLSLLQPLLAEAISNVRTDHVIEIQILQAMAHFAREAEPAAIAALAEAIRISEPANYIRSYVNEGLQMAILLEKLREHERRQSPTPYIDTLLDAFPKEHAGNRVPPEHPIPDPLSEREVEVINELARGASNQEIVDRLVLSAETVKRHLYNVFLKLGVNNRTQAVVRAQYLGLPSEGQ